MLGSAAAAAATGGGGKQVTEGFSRAQHTKLSDRLTTDWDSVRLPCLTRSPRKATPTI